MKADIHPDYHDITVVLTDGTEFQTRSCYGKAGDRLVLDVDITTHPAWNKGVETGLKKKGQNAKFIDRFGEMTYSRKKAGS